jgi:hypothetical protein
VSATSVGFVNYTTAYTEVVIQNINYNPLPSPRLQAVTFDSSGSNLLFIFASPTNAVTFANQSQFDCSNLVTFPGYSSSLCSWPSSTVLSAVVAPSSNPAPVIGSRCSFNGSFVKSQCVQQTDCSKNPRGVFQFKNITASVNAVAPTISLVLPSIVGSCSGLTIDPTGSSGNGGRLWTAVKWSVASPSSPRLASNCSVIAGFLNARFGSTSRLATIPSSILPVGIYSISLQLTNFLGRTSVLSANVEVSAIATNPLVSISSPSTLQIYRGQPLTLYGVAYLPLCAPLPPNFVLVFSWAVYNGLNLAPTLVSTSSDPRTFMLPAFSFESSMTYTVKFSATVTIGGVVALSSPTAAASVTVQVGRSGVVSSIAGGAAQTTSVFNSFLLDASASYDQDYPNSAALTFQWTCIVSAPIYGNPCPPQLQTAISSSSAVISIPPQTAPAATYSFTCLVSNSFGKSSSSTVLVNVVKMRIPLLLMNPVAVKYNSGDSIVISATVQAPNNSIAVWSSNQLTSSQFAAAAGTATVVNVFSTPKTPLAFFNVQLMLVPYSLTSGLTYTFQLTCGFALMINNVSVMSTTSQSTATVTIVMNQPPTSGSLAISPATGYALNTTYTLQASLWTDSSADDLPLLYSFSYFAASPSQSYVVRTSNQLAYVIAFLGQGLASRKYVVFGVVTVTDQFGGFASTTATTTVNPPKSLAALNSAIRSILTSSLSSGDASGVQQVIGAGTSSLNTVNCQVSVACNLLNREVCSLTPKTCGACLSGFTGDGGDANTFCFQTPTKTKGKGASRRLLQSLSLSPAGVACVQNSSCTSLWCRSNGVCADSQKQCPNQCSMQYGVCTYVDSDSNIISSCATQDPYCFAVCRCLDLGAKYGGMRFGQDCSLSRATYSSKVAMRNRLGAAMQAVERLQNLNADIINSRGNSISSILSDASEGSLVAFMNCSNVLISTVLSNPQLSCQSPTSSAAVLGAMSTLMGYKSFASPEMVLAVVSALLAFNMGCQQNVALMQQPLTFVTSNIRIITSAYLASATNHLNPFSPTQGWAVPTSSFESFGNVDMGGANLTFSSALDSESFGVSMFQLTNNPLRARTDSHAIGVQIRHISATDVGSSATFLARPLNANNALDTSLSSLQSIISVHLRLMNKNPINYVHETPFRATAVCHRRRLGYHINVTCGVRDVPLWCSGQPGRMEYVCPYKRTFPNCTLWDDASGSFLPSSLCNATDYSPTNTSCVCSLNPLPSGGRTSLSLNSQAWLFSTIKAEVITEFSHIWIPRSAAAVVEAGKVVGGNVIAWVVLFYVGMAVFLWMDFRAHEAIESSRKPTNPAVRSVQSYFRALMPSEFIAEKDWKKIMWHWLQRDHGVISLLMPFKPEEESKSFKFVLFVGRIILWLGIDTGIVSFLWADNGQCEYLVTSASCEFGDTSNLQLWCKWNPVEEYCAYVGPRVDIFTVIVVVSVIMLIAIPMNRFLEILLIESFYASKYILRKYVKSKNRISIGDDTDELEMFWQIDDELACAQNLSSKILLAARLRKMQEFIDFVIPSAESQILVSAAEDDFKRYGRHMLAIDTSSVYFGRRKVSDTGQHARYSLGSGAGIGARSVLEKITHARLEANDIKNQMQFTKSTHEQENVLIRRFLVDNFAGYRKALVSRYTLIDLPSDGDAESNRRFIRSCCCITFIPVAFGVIIHFILLWNETIGSRASAIWAAAVYVILMLDLIVFQPATIWLKWVIMNRSISQEMHQIIDAITIRFGAVLCRKAGAMRDSASLVQHFNPACRAARMFPHLPLARFLMSLNDFDVPFFDVKVRPSVSKMSKTLLDILGVFPYFLQDCIVDGAVVIALNGLILALYQLGTISIGASVAGAVTVLSLAAYMIYYSETSKVSGESGTVAVLKRMTTLHRPITAEVRSKEARRKSMFQSRFGSEPRSGSAPLSTRPAASSSSAAAKYKEDLHEELDGSFGFVMGSPSSPNLIRRIPDVGTMGLSQSPLALGMTNVENIHSPQHTVGDQTVGDQIAAMSKKLETLTHALETAQTTRSRRKNAQRTRQRSLRSENNAVPPGSAAKYAAPTDVGSVTESLRSGQRGHGTDHSATPSQNRLRERRRHRHSGAADGDDTDARRRTHDESGPGMSARRLEEDGGAGSATSSPERVGGGGVVGGGSVGSASLFGGEVEADKTSGPRLMRQTTNIAPVMQLRAQPQFPTWHQ